MDTELVSDDFRISNISVDGNISYDWIVVNESYENATCPTSFSELTWSDPRSIVIFMILCLIIVLVILGNTLVIVAICTNSKLRTVTNYLVVSLAVADLTLGIVVLPFSATLEVFGLWVFGRQMCSIWLATDVWMCTASILNLCAISLDRYIAVTKPMRYSSIITSRKGKLLIAGVWLVSFLICLPPLIGWNDRQQTNEFLNIFYSSSNTSDVVNNCDLLKCELNLESGYVLYSALGSFFIPTFIMLFFYLRIYIAASKTQQAIKKGFRVSRRKNGGKGFSDETNVTLRIHRGRASLRSENDSPYRGRKPIQQIPKINTTTSIESIQKQAESNGQNSKHFPLSINVIKLRNSSSNLLPHKNKRPSIMRRETVATMGVNSNMCEPNNSTSTHIPYGSDNSGSKKVSKMGKRNIKTQVKRIRMETKAAKTLSIVVGCFIVCWLPFFSLYVYSGFDGIVHPLVFSLMFWLGYCNSLLNPFIYAAFSTDFRLAFKKIIYRCFCIKVKSQENKTITQLLMRTIKFPRMDDEDDRL